jgi:HD-GYP domain-containing protein (c-di-GMP phosphodiesterase class II)
MSAPALRLAEPLAALAMASDLGAALPAETSLATCLVAMELAARVDLGGASMRDVYYAALLRHLGCTASATEETRLMGDDLELKGTMGYEDPSKPAAALPRMWKGFARGKGKLATAGAIARFVRGVGEVAPRAFRAHCEVAVRLAERLAMPEAVKVALDQTYERHDGKGLPRGLAGEAIHPIARVTTAAELAAMFLRVGGAGTVREVARARRGGQLHPAVADALLGDLEAIVAPATAAALWSPALEAEPAPRAEIGPGRLEEIARVFADFADVKSPFTLGHSHGVAALAGAAARALGESDARGRDVTLAALFHDIGRVSVSNAIWDKPGPLDAGEWERVRMHPYHTARVLACSPRLAPLGAIAASDHERCDGSGYFKSARAPGLEMAAKVLAAADVYQALLEPRPHRPARAPDEAAKVLAAEAAAGRLDRAAANAVLDAAGHRAGRARAGWPKGLSDREVDVLRLLVRGLTDKEIARALDVSPRTVQHHNQHIYGKIGVTTRGAAALFAVENDLL